MPNQSTPITIKKAALAFGLIAIHSLVFAQFSLSAFNAGSPVVQNDQVRVELVAYAPEGVAPGKKLWAGLQIEHKQGWHSYWKNPGDSGQATRLVWKLPVGVEAGAIDWPAPKKFNVSRLSNFGYDQTVLLPVPLTIGKNFVQGRPDDVLELKLTAYWLLCRTECVPQDGDFVLRIPVQGTTAMYGPQFERTRELVPVQIENRSEALISKQGLVVTAKGLPAAWRGQKISAFCETPEIIQTPKSPSPVDGVHQIWNKDGSWTAVIPFFEFRSESPSTVPFVFSNAGQSFRTDVKILGSWKQAK
jgi:DsbC/DsbD-like thiol-disulfide interchange protein